MAFNSDGLVWDRIPAERVEKPSAMVEKHYRRRLLELPRIRQVKIEAWILEQAEIEFVPVKAGLQAVE